MKLIKLHFIGFVNEGNPKIGDYIDMVIYEPLYVRSDKILSIRRYLSDSECPPIPTLTEDFIAQEKDGLCIEMVVDNFIVEEGNNIHDEYNIKERSSVVTFDDEYTEYLNEHLLYCHYGFNPCFEEGAFAVYESPEEIAALIG